MKAKILILLVLAVIINACNKDKYKDAPQLTFKSVNTSLLYPNQVLSFDIDITDAQGDVQDTLWIQKITQNCAASNFSGAYPVPAFPATKNFKATYQVSFGYGLGLGYPAIKEPSCLRQNDTCVFKFWTKDLAKHYSDTIVSPTIVIIHR
jgi:hypothetical protein